MAVWLPCVQENAQPPGIVCVPVNSSADGVDAVLVNKASRRKMSMQHGSS